MKNALPIIIILIIISMLSLCCDSEEQNIKIAIYEKDASDDIDITDIRFIMKNNLKNVIEKVEVELSNKGYYEYQNINLMISLPSEQIESNYSVSSYGHFKYYYVTIHDSIKRQSKSRFNIPEFENHYTYGVDLNDYYKDNINDIDIIDIIGAERITKYDISYIKDLLGRNKFRDNIDYLRLKEYHEYDDF